MADFDRWQSGMAGLLALGLTAGAATPLVLTLPATAQTTFYDVPAGYWAQGFIQPLTARGIIAGFPDGSFRPNEPVTRAQFAAMVSKAFSKSAIRSAVEFGDVPDNSWAAQAIQSAYTSGFMAGYPGNLFNPSQNIPRVQVLVALANGLNYTPATNAENTLQQYYSDASAIPGYARTSLAAATERRLVVSYPDVRLLNPNQIATRADVAAFIYQALVSSNNIAALSSAYIVGQSKAGTSSPLQRQVRIPSGTALPVRYTQAERILVAPNETAPLTLSIKQNIITAQGNVLIPSGSEVVGELRPAQGGSQFVSQELVFPNGQRIPISATSEVITKTEQISKGSNAGNILQSTVVGAAAGAGIAAVTGDRAVATEEVLGGAGVGALIGLFLGRDQVTLITIDPNTDLNLKLTTDLALL